MRLPCHPIGNVIRQTIFIIQTFFVPLSQFFKYIVMTHKPQDIVYESIRKALQSGELKPGMRLPAERKLAEQFGISRGYIREALQTLETYGIIRTQPQSGSVIVGLDISAIDGLLTNVLQLSSQDFASLAEMRCILEENAASLCAQRCTKSDMALIEDSLNQYIEAAQAGDDEKRQEADFHLHRCIAAGAHNSTLQQMLGLITPDITTIYRQQRVCRQVGINPTEEHINICRAIKEHDSEKAAVLMRRHLRGVAEYAARLRKDTPVN